MQPFFTKREIWRFIHGISVELFCITCVVLMVLDLRGAPASWHIETWQAVCALFVLLAIYPWRNCRVWYGMLFYITTTLLAICYAVLQWVFPDTFLILTLEILWGLSAGVFTMLEILYWRLKRRKNRVRVVQIKVSFEDEYSEQEDAHADD